MTQSAFREMLESGVGPNPNCKKCKGKGVFKYDPDHTTVCDACCPHDRGRWLLLEHYGNKNGKWCCLRGCGHTTENEHDQS